MTEAQKKMADLLGLNEKDFQRPDHTEKARIEKVEHRADALEATTDDLILMMADLIGGN